MIPTTVLEIVPREVLLKLDAAGFEIRQKPKARGKEYTEEFEREVWGPYPRKAGTSKANAFRRFSALDSAEKQALKQSIPVYAQRVRGSEERFVSHLEFFITRRQFETLQPKAFSVPTAKINIDPDWETIIRRYRVTTDWPQQYGPAPGQAGCRVPPEFL